MRSWLSPFEQVTGRFDGVVGQPDRAGEHVRRAARQRRQRRLGAGEAVGDLVERAVAAEADDHVDAVVGRPLGQAGGVAPTVGLDHRDLVVRGERLLDHDPAPRRHRGRRRVHDEQESHWRQLVTPAPLLARSHPYEHRRLREADPRSGRARRAQRRSHVEARRKVDPRRLRLVRRRDGAATGRQGRWR